MVSLKICETSKEIPFIEFNDLILFLINSSQGGVVLSDLSCEDIVSPKMCDNSKEIPFIECFDLILFLINGTQYIALLSGS